MALDAAPPAVAAALPAELYMLVFERLDSFRDLCECSRVCRRWRTVADSDGVWGAMLRRRCVDVEAERRAQAGVRGSKAIFAGWHRRYRGFTDSYTRMRRVFGRLESWAEANCPLLRQSLAPGLGWMGDEPMPVRELLDVVHDSPAMRDFIMAHHLHDGQRRRSRYIECGMFGTYECYGQACSLSWLSSRMLQVVAIGRFRILVFALCVNTQNYLSVVVGCPPEHEAALMHHVVQLQPQSHRIEDRGLFGDFIAAYVDGLVAGRHDVCNGLISMMPNAGPHVGSSVTRGIRTTVSAMFCFDETPHFRVYRYQVTFEIVDPAALGVDSVQLVSRHWLIHYSNREYIQAEGAGVVGEFPIISTAEPYFRYCSRMRDEPEGLVVVGFEGRFSVVPGTIDAPLGPEFSLPVPYVELPIPMEIL
ncbi:hypothetical protein H4R18_004936 [Coemansia javaensis]|uniref:F-box domain-containing protein n=1 Tax=Coemansia javaensis TaxID=2761396 RepID=A0A9W8HA80_9FUNG|nr:hypothetical protein H4R18_004936 [Coemansia javaensis]